MHSRLTLESGLVSRGHLERSLHEGLWQGAQDAQSGGAPALRPGAIAQSPGREDALAWASLPQRSPASSVLAREGAGCGSVGDVPGLLRVPWTARRSNQSILKEISLEYSLEGLMLKLKLQYFGHLMGHIGQSPADHEAELDSKTASPALLELTV